MPFIKRGERVNRKPNLKARKFSELIPEERELVRKVALLCRMRENAARKSKLKEQLLPARLWPMLEELTEKK